MSKSNSNTEISEYKSEDNLAKDPIRVKMNLFELENRLDTVFLYDVIISPNVVNISTRARILENFIAEKSLSPYILHWDRIVLTHRLDKIEGTAKVDSIEYAVRLIFAENIPFKSDEQIQNEIFNQVLDKIGMSQIGRNHYWTNKAVVLTSNQDIKITRGITSAIHGGTYLETDLVSKVIHAKSVYEEIEDLLSERKSRNEIEALFMGRNFLTEHNKKTYVTVGIKWDVNIDAKFAWDPMMHSKEHIMYSNQKITPKDVNSSPCSNQEISYRHYFLEKYGIHLKYTIQPFLVSSISNKDNKKEILIPAELAVLINLSDAEREDFTLMREISQTSQLSPLDRQKKLMDIVKDPKLVKEIGNWKLIIIPSMVGADAYRFKPVQLELATKEVSAQDLQRELNRTDMLVPVDLHNWVIVYESKTIRSDEISRLVEDFRRLGAVIGMNISKPKVYMVENIGNFLTSYSGKENGNLIQILLTISRGRNSRLYKNIKQRCYEQLGIPSQHMRLKSIECHRDNIIFNIIRQMNLKAFVDPQGQDFTSGLLWGIANPIVPDESLIIGIDVWHGFSGVSRSVAGIVTSFNKGLSYYADALPLNQVGREIIPHLGELLKKRLQQYYWGNKHYPKYIFVFRDGVGESQFGELLEKEFANILGSLPIPKEEYPKLAILLANKRIHRRIFVPNTSGETINPPSGTIVEGIGNSSEFDNFYLVSHTSHQGTVTPTHYTVLQNNTELTTEELSGLAYQLSHLYYNWAGGIRTPAPIENAHKLAFQAGQVGLKKIHANLQNTYYYL